MLNSVIASGAKQSMTSPPAPPHKGGVLDCFVVPPRNDDIKNS